MNDQRGNQDRAPLFYLVPLNERARDAVRHEHNRPFLVILDDGMLALSIGHVRSKSSSPSTIVTLGRSANMDIYLPSLSMSTFQCSFERNLKSNMILFYDRSYNNSSCVAGGNSTPFERGAPRQAVVLPKLNNIIGLGGEYQNLFRFGLVWLQEPLEVHPISRQDQTEEDKVETMESTRMLTRIHTQTTQQILRYELLGPIAKGGFGKVFKAVDVRHGNLVAIKVLQKAKGTYWELVKREVETLEKLRHDHIIDYVGTLQDDSLVSIITGLKEGSLETLDVAGKPDVVQCIVFQMLQALDYLTYMGFTHRDVKPANILYTSQPNGTYVFQLADFGISDLVDRKPRGFGTLFFLAPEMCFGKQDKTSKCDIWSLYVTMLWKTQERSLLRELTEMDLRDKYARIVEIAPTAMKPYLDIEEMSRIHPTNRASAAQMLVKCFGGVGLTTPRRLIPPIPNPTEVRVGNLTPSVAWRRIEHRRLQRVWDIPSSILSTLPPEGTMFEEPIDDGESMDYEE
ncbi:kinase-like protein [Hypomontagnella monticulosa]|nr:kinase-like protein [Hypomontagnella monticulosa]